MHPDPALWVATTIIDELDNLASECREAATDHQGKGDRRSLESARALSQAADACDDIIQMIRTKYSAVVSRH